MKLVIVLWPFLTVVMLIAGILVIRARLLHSGLAIVIGTSVSLMTQFSRIVLAWLLPLGDDGEIEKFQQNMMIGQGIEFVADGLVAYGLLALALIVFRQRREGPMDRSEF